MACSSDAPGYNDPLRENQDIREVPDNERVANRTSRFGTPAAASIHRCNRTPCLTTARQDVSQPLLNRTFRLELASHRDDQLRRRTGYFMYLSPVRPGSPPPRCRNSPYGSRKSSPMASCGRRSVHNDHAIWLLLEILRLTLLFYCRDRSISRRIKGCSSQQGCCPSWQTRVGPTRILV